MVFNGKRRRRFQLDESTGVTSPAMLPNTLADDVTRTAIVVNTGAASAGDSRAGLGLPARRAIHRRVIARFQRIINRNSNKFRHLARVLGCARRSAWCLQRRGMWSGAPADRLESFRLSRRIRYRDIDRLDGRSSDGCDERLNASGGIAKWQVLLGRRRRGRVRVGAVNDGMHGTRGSFLKMEIRRKARGR